MLEALPCWWLALQKLGASRPQTMLRRIATALAHTVLVALPIETVALAVLF